MNRSASFIIVSIDANSNEPMFSIGFANVVISMNAIDATATPFETFNDMKIRSFKLRSCAFQVEIATETALIITYIPNRSNDLKKKPHVDGSAMKSPNSINITIVRKLVNIATNFFRFSFSFIADQPNTIPKVVTDNTPLPPMFSASV